MKRDPWADSTASYSSQRSNEFAASFEDFNNNSQQQNDPWYYLKTKINEIYCCCV